MEEILREIKAELRANMNGIASRRMREAGLLYHVNFGVELPRLQQIAADVRSRFSPPHQLPTPQGAGCPKGGAGSSPFTSSPFHLFTLSLRLWQENVRESKILAAMLMPTEEFPSDLADLWASQIPNAEIAQTTVLYLFSRLPYAAELAFPWIASDREMLQLCGLLLITRLLISGTEFNEHSRNEIIDQAHSLFDSPNLHVRKAAHNLSLRLEEYI